MAPTVQTPGHSPGCGSSLRLPLPPISSSPEQPWASGLLSSFFWGGAALCGNCDLSSHTRDGTRAPALEAPGLDYPTPREVPDILLIDVSHPTWLPLPHPTVWPCLLSVLPGRCPLYSLGCIPHPHFNPPKSPCSLPHQCHFLHLPLQHLPTVSAPTHPSNLRSLFPPGLSKEPTCQCRCGFDPWVGKIPWRRK